MRNKWVELMVRRAEMTTALAKCAADPSPWNNNQIVRTQALYEESVNAIGRDVVDASWEKQDARRYPSAVSRSADGA